MKSVHKIRWYAKCKCYVLNLSTKREGGVGQRFCEWRLFQNGWFWAWKYFKNELVFYLQIIIMCFFKSHVKMTSCSLDWLVTVRSQAHSRNYFWTTNSKNKTGFDHFWKFYKFFDTKLCPFLPPIQSTYNIVKLTKTFCVNDWIFICAPCNWKLEIATKNPLTLTNCLKNCI